MLVTIRGMAHPPALALIVDDADKRTLRAVVRAPTSEQRAVTRARVVLRSAEGTPIERIAAELCVAVMTVKLWRRRYGQAGLADVPRPGHPPTYTREDRDRLVALTLGPPPEGSTHWSVRRMAQRTGMSPSTVQRIWAELGLKVRHQTTNGHWFVAWAPREGGLPGIDYLPRFREVPSPPGHFLADPFLAEHEGRTFVFVESCPHRRSAGVIAVLELRGESVSEPVTVLDRGYHLSYPAVFRWNDDWYMTPETASNRTVELYRAVEFPWRWELDTVLLRGVYAVDPTLFEHDGRWWLYTNIASFGASPADELHLFWADSPRGPFTPHGANPVVSDVRRARPAGMPLVHNGNLYRPGQNSAIRYGHSMTMSRVDRLDPQHYREVPTGKILADWLPGAICTHTLNVSDRYVVTDGMRLVPRWAAARAGRQARWG